MPCARDELGGTGRLSHVNLRYSVYIMYPLYSIQRGRFAIQLATSMDVTSMDTTRCSESSRDREERLWRRRERERARRAAETAKQRAHRIWQRRERDRARHALQSSERRERELQRMHVPVMTD